MPNLIDLMAGLEQQTLNIPAGAPGAAQTTIAVTGWAWWQLAVARFTINNSAGAAVAWPFVSMLSGAIVVFTAGTSISVAVGSFGVPSFGMFAGNTTGASLVLMSGVAFCPVVDEGAVVAGWTLGDGTTTMVGGNLVIVGRRKSNKAK